MSCGCGCVTEGPSGDGCDLGSTLCMYDFMNGDLFVLSWARVRRVMRGRISPNDTAYKRWSCHNGLKLLCKLCRTFPLPAMGARFTIYWGMPVMRTH